MPWAEVFDLLSSEYGWKTEYIMNRPIKEIKWRVKEIGKRKNNDREFIMKINGIPVEKKAEKPVKLTKDQERAMELALQRAKERKAKEYGRIFSN